LARTDFRAAAARRLSEDRELSPAFISLLNPEDAGRSQGVRVIPLERIEPNPDQPRMEFDEAALEELAASIREHGVLQPILVRPIGPAHYQLVAGERRGRASRKAGLGHPGAHRRDRRRHRLESRSSRTSSARPLPLDGGHVRPHGP
jgi:hypothetical protein